MTASTSPRARVANASSDMFGSLLIANRGEIAARIARTCRRLGIRCVAVYSEADCDAPHTSLADEAVAIGPAPVAESYLAIETVVEAARATGCDAVHPGYGLLSENPRFIAAVAEAGLTFVGPTAQVVALMGDKQRARAFAREAGLCVVPGFDGELGDEAATLSFATALGYPLMVKAAAGGGGIGMKVARDERELGKAIAECRRRSTSAFGSDKLYIERYIERPRHVEVQVLADHQGQAVHLFERECSIQRRHQKVIEEAPSVLMERFEGLRARMTDAALCLTRAAGYTNAGTVEFIVDDAGDFYFIEMNTRLQVEHPVTEMVTGLDLVELQLRIAAGEPLPAEASSVALDGHAIECRLYAENPNKGFLPSPGRVDGYREPDLPGVRIDSGIAEGWTVTPHYDPLLAKLVAHGATRDQAAERMSVALDQLVIDGPVHNGALHRAALASEAFRSGAFHTGWLEGWYRTALETDET